MIINKNSWHYKAISAISSNSDVPKNLCPYVRKLLFMGIFLIWLIGMIGFVFFQSGIPVAAYFGITGVLGGILAFFAGALGWAALIAVIVGVVFVVVMGKEKLKERQEEKEMKRVESGTPKSLVSSWIEAKHDKICPVLEFKND